MHAARIVAALGAFVLAAAAPTATAHPDHHYEGGCALLAFEDPTPTGSLGGPGMWVVAVTATVVATTADGVPAPETPIGVRCTLYVNVPWGDAVAASGTGHAHGANAVVFGIEATDSISMCEHVSVAGESHGSCASLTATPVVPHPVYDAVSFVRDNTDPNACTALAVLAPGVPGVVDVTPDGDVFVPPLTDPVHDCPPYGPSARDYPNATIHTVLP